MDSASPQPCFSREELAQRGDEIYERKILPHLSPDDRGKFVAIDVVTEDYEISSDLLNACDLLRARLSDPQLWLRRVGVPYLYHFGFRLGRVRVT